MIKQDVNKYLKSGKYLPVPGSGNQVYRHILGWTNYLICDSLLYSHRKTHYRKIFFDEAYHTHDFYELVIYIRGNVDFICESHILAPPPFSIVWSRPGEFHNARLLSDGLYERYVFRFAESVFSFDGGAYPMLDFMKGDENHFTIGAEEREEILDLLSEMDAALEKTPLNPLYCYALFIRLMEMLNRVAASFSAEKRALPQSVLEIKRYVEDNYATLGSVKEISDHFFYSREHISRLFKQYFNMSVAEYLTRYRIARSIELLESGKSVTAACFEAGFGSMSAFSASFKRIKGCLPSRWIKQGI